MDIERQAFYFMQIPALISLITEMIVPLSYFLFKDLRQFKYIQLVLLISIGNIIGSIGAVIGYQSNLYLCSFQAIMTDVGFLYAALWTLANTYQLWLVVDSLTIISDKEMIILHLVIWTFPLFIAFIPYAWSKNVYGLVPDFTDPWCFVSSNIDPANYVFLSLFIFWGWMILIFLLMVYYLFKILMKMKNIGHLPYIVKASFMKLYLYPLIYIISWLPSFFSNTAWINTTSKERIWVDYCNFSNSITGFLVAIAFWISNPKVRQLWYKLIFNRKLDNDITLNSSINEINDIDELTRNSIDDTNRITVSLIARNSHIT